MMARRTVELQNGDANMVATIASVPYCIKMSTIVIK